MLGLLNAIFNAVRAGLAVFSQERALYNSPEMAKNKLDIARQASTDAVRNAEAVLADPTATLDQHAEALRALRLAAS
jgi:hypothetical protein